MPCFFPLKGYKDPHTGGLTFNQTGTSQKLEVACGQCLGCRLDHSIVWAIRIIHESYMYLDKQGSCFVTLTYRDPEECTDEQLKNRHFIPADYSLRPSDVSKFIRRLRKQEAKNAKKQKRSPNTIRYFYCGEYGDANERPHYHICLFNHTFSDQALFKDVEGFYTYTSATLESLWPYGFSTISALNYDTAAYTAKYSLKKVTGNRADEHYLRCDDDGQAYWLKPEFIRMSTGNKKNKRQGLGAGFYDKFKMDFDDDSSPIPGHGIRRKIPRYYESILRDERPEVLEQIKNIRQIYLSAHKSDFSPERLHDKYICAQARRTKRNL